jgi:phosphatidylinositol alpha 1,6-mannosyltransferase
MRIALFTEAYAPQVNGVVRTQTELVRFLRSRGHEVLLCVPRNKANPPEPQVVDFRSIPFPLYPEMPIILPHWKFHRPEFAEVAAFKPDLVHVMSPAVLGYFSQLWARRNGCRVVASYETDVIRYLHYYGFGFAEPILWRYLRWLYNHCQRTYAPSRVTRDQLIRGGIRDVRVFERGVDSDQFHPSKRNNEARQVYGVGPDGLLIVYAGRLSKEKSIEVLLNAFQRSVGEYPTARLVIAGDGPHRRALARRYTHPGINFTDWKRGEELSALLASADVFALPSSTETLSLISMESMASGVPVLAMNSGGVTEVVQNDTTGFLADSPGDFEAKLRQLLQDPELRARLGANGRNYAERKTWTRAFEDLERDYLEVMTHPPVR